MLWRYSVAVSPVPTVRCRHMPTLTSLDRSSRQAGHLHWQPQKDIAAEQPSGLQFGVLPFSRRTYDICELTEHVDNSSLGKHHDGGPEVYLPVKYVPQVDQLQDPT